MTNILTDSTADLSPAILQKYGIDAIPLQVYIDKNNFKDGELTLQQLFALVEKGGELPKTSAPSVADFMHFFDREGDSIYISISSRLSATHANSLLARDQLNGRRITIIDSLNLSTGIGLLALLAADLRDQGLPVDQIISAVQAAIPRVRTSFIIDTMDYLYKGGRCTALQAIFGSMLKIRPVIEVRPDGTLGVKDKIRGTRLKGLDSLIANYQAHLPAVDNKRVFVTHTGCDEDAQYLSERIRSLTPDVDVLVTTAGATIASHCGPGTIGVLFLTK